MCTGEKLAKKLDKRLAQYRAEEEGETPALLVCQRCRASLCIENSGSVKRSKVAAGSLVGGHGAQGDVQSAKGKASIILYINVLYVCMYYTEEEKSD